MVVRTTEHFVAAALLLAAQAAIAQPADLIITGASVWTVDRDNPRAQALAMRGGSIIAVGTDAEALAHQGDDTRLIDARGAFVMPGFNDSHIHFASAARFHEFNLMRTHAQDQFVARVEDVVSRLESGEWILGGLWGAYDDWAEGSAGGETRTRFTPDMSLIEDLTRDHPLFIRRFDGSQFAANRRALELAGLDPDDPKAPRVEFLRDALGRPTGIMEGSGALELFVPIIPSNFSHERRLAQTRHALKEIARHGVTNVSDMSDDAQLEIYRELHDRDELTCRIHFRYPLDRWGELMRRRIEIGSGDPWIRLGALKGHIDGIMGTSSARFFDGYAHDPENRGRWRRLMVDESGQVVEGQFLQYMLDADRANLQLTVHAIGDEANSLLLDYLEELNRINGPKDRRFRIVHAQVIAPKDFARFADLGVVAEVQPFHLSDDMRWMEERIGTERCRGAYAFRSLDRAGAVLSFGTDWPGTSAAEYHINPMYGLYAAVARKTLTGEPESGWFPEERITIERAIEAYTLGSAYANFENDVKGSIEVGKLADLVILDRNLLEIPPAELLDVQVIATIVDGRLVYERDR